MLSRLYIRVFFISPDIGLALVIVAGCHLQAVIKLMNIHLFLYKILAVAVALIWPMDTETITGFCKAFDSINTIIDCESNMNSVLELIFANFDIMLLVLARISGIVFVSVIFGRRNVPAVFYIGLIVSLTFILVAYYPLFERNPLQINSISGWDSWQ